MTDPFDPVERPQHYADSQYELSDVVIEWKLNWCRGNVVKYVARAGKKVNEIEDLKKARWYLDREIRRMEETA